MKELIGPMGSTLDRGHSATQDLQCLTCIGGFGLQCASRRQRINCFAAMANDRRPLKHGKFRKRSLDTRPRNGKAVLRCRDGFQVVRFVDDQFVEAAQHRVFFAQARKKQSVIHDDDVRLLRFHAGPVEKTPVAVARSADGLQAVVGRRGKGRKRALFCRSEGQLGTVSGSRAFQPDRDLDLQRFHDRLALGIARFLQPPAQTEVVRSSLEGYPPNWLTAAGLQGLRTRSVRPWQRAAPANHA